MPNKTILTVWEVWEYDVWGDAEEWTVNDRSCMDREYPIRLKPVTYNAGTPREFIGASPSDYQLGKLFGFTGKIDTDGDDTHIYVNRESDGYPLGELHCESHKSLSPIQEA